MYLLLLVRATLYFLHMQNRLILNGHRQNYRNFPTSCNGYSKKREVSQSVTAFDLVTLVQILQRLQTTTNSIMVVLRSTLSLFTVARSSTFSVHYSVFHTGGGKGGGGLSPLKQFVSPPKEWKNHSKSKIVAFYRLQPCHTLPLAGHIPSFIIISCAYMYVGQIVEPGDEASSASLTNTVDAPQLHFTQRLHAVNFGNLSKFCCAHILTPCTCAIM